MLALILALAAPALAAPQQPAAAGDGWHDLFDGQSLAGWHRVGGKASYRVEDGAIVGTTVLGQPNSFLRTDRDYGDFELELDLRIDPDINSGIQLRSHTRKNGRVYGLQVEIDPSKRAWSGGIYDEARRGWLDDLKDDPKARAAFAVDGWNHYRVVCRGDSIRTWVNEVPAGDLVDSMDLTGFIGLQVHGIGNETGKRLGQRVRWRNIRIRDLGARTWQPLWNGKDLRGWHALPGGDWRVEDGVLVGTSGAGEPRHGVLLSDATFADFAARLQFRAVHGNSGFYFRCMPADGAVGVHGLQAEIDAAGGDTGGLYETGGRAWVEKPEAVKGGYRAGEWNEMTVSAHGGRVVVHLNGRRTAELRDDPGRREGHLGLQLHGGQEMRVEVRSLEIMR